MGDPIASTGLIFVVATPLQYPQRASKLMRKPWSSVQVVVTGAFAKLELHVSED